MIKRQLILILPTLSFLIWVYWIRDYCIFYVGSVLPNSTWVFLAIEFFNAILFLLSLVTILFCLIQLFSFFYRKHLGRYRVTRNIVLILLFFFVFQVKPEDPSIPFALGLKKYYTKEIDLLQFQQWIESGQVKEVEIRLSEPYDKYNFPDPVLDDIQKLSAGRIDIKRTTSGTPYLRLWSYKLFIGNYGFVVGVNKDELPFEEYEPTEYRMEIDSKSFVWIRER